MSANSRLTVAVHVLSWMELNRRRGHEWSTSDRISRSVQTNAVVIRRLLSELRDGGIVASRRGAGAGWSLARDASSLTLREVDEALGAESVYAMHRNEPSPRCVVARGIRPALAPVYARVDDAVRHVVLGNAKPSLGPLPASARAWK